MTGEQPTSDDLTDGRRPGEWKTKYPPRAWCWIIIELCYLCVVLLVGAAALIYIGIELSAATDRNCPTYVALLNTHVEQRVLRWMSVAFAGMLGGVVFDLKWLYHAVAKNIWHENRILWRLIVPVNSALVSLFFAFMITSGIVPLLDADAFSGVYFGLGFGFLFGYFSDNVIAALQRLAQRLFGTLEKGVSPGGRQSSATVEPKDG